ncbi:hypothetical protein N8746_03010 [Alphaproteobacteria bacterium]|nr:hypothetical protein [Alphaproteobacteria bacterium]
MFGFVNKASIRNQFQMEKQFMNESHWVEVEDRIATLWDEWIEEKRLPNETGYNDDPMHGNHINELRDVVFDFYNDIECPVWMTLSDAEEEMFATTVVLKFLLERLSCNQRR